MANRSKRTNSRDQKFFKALAHNGVIGYACDMAGYSRTQAYQYKKNDPEFAAKWAESLERSTERLEAEAIRRANEGVVSYALYKGGIVFVDTETPLIDPKTKEQLTDKNGKPMWVQAPLVERKYSDTLTMFMLKARRPETYRERYDVSTGPRGDTSTETLTDAQLEEIIRGGNDEG